MQESDSIANNKDTSKGPVFQPAKTDYADTFKLGSKDSKDRSQYDTGGYTCPDTLSQKYQFATAGSVWDSRVCACVQWTQLPSQ